MDSDFSEGDRQESEEDSETARVHSREPVWLYEG